MSGPAASAEVPWVVALGPAETTATERARIRTALDGFDALDGALVLVTYRRLERNARRLETGLAHTRVDIDRTVSAAVNALSAVSRLDESGKWPFPRRGGSE